MYNSLAVFCGSRQGNNPIYAHYAAQLGVWMAEHKITLIYGGGSLGIMGAIANNVMGHGGKVIGVIPDLLTQWEVGHKNITQLHIVPDMHIRKKMMYELCDAAVVLPGGYGTLDELFEMLTWNSLNIHSKKIILLNADGYYTHLLAHIKNMQTEGFLHEKWSDRLVIVETPQAIFNFLSENKS